MDLLERIGADLKAAMIGRDQLTTGTLRLLKSELQNAAISSGSDLDEKGIQQVIRREAKKRRESFQLYTDSGDTERAAQEEAEAKVLEAYLPAQTDPAAVEAFVTTLAGKGLNKGDAIRQTIEHFQGQADGKTVAETVNRLL
ncbi:MAG: GatB/YqeY domain-containing protein [bacterium]